MPVARRLAAILAADVAGYSRLMEANEEGTHERLKAHLRDLIDPNHLTSAIAVQLLKAIQPQLEPLLRSPPTEVARAPFDASLPMLAEREGAEAPIAPPMAAVLNRPPPQRAAIDHNGG